MELVNDQGLRIDGRRPDELRLIKCRLGVYDHADGSAYLEQGNTKVIATVFGPNEVRGAHKSKAQSDLALVNCHYSMSPFSKSERKAPRARDRKNTEMTINLHQALTSVIKAELMPRSQIDVMVEVLAADGGNCCAAINAATLALIDAGVPLKEYVIACTASLSDDNVPMVDISNLEQNLGGPCLTVAMLPNSEQIALIEMSHRMHVEHLGKVLKMAQQGCMNIYNILDEAVNQSLRSAVHFDQ
ncbi:exosome complex component RRP41 [Cimex lectularius]|uniref:Putative exosome complex component RRP41 n=1 Tax=Cimex lectularius TaxID=79782 RepID=A0A8I6RVT8_CIMLE|nr:exosome complex component RRP41 [Cimex lectularius]